MSLACQHGTTAEQALQKIKDAINEHGYSNYVKWDGHHASVSVGFGRILRIKGKVTDREAIVECGGAFGGTALSKCREIVGRVFPNGKIV